MHSLLMGALRKQENEKFAEVFGFGFVKKKKPALPRPPPECKCGEAPPCLHQNVALMQLSGTLSRVHAAFENFADEDYDMDPCKGVFALCYNQIISDSTNNIHPRNVGIQRKYDGLVFVRMPEKRFVATAYRMAENDFWMMIPKEIQYSLRINGYVNSVRSILDKYDLNNDKIPAVFRLSDAQSAGGEDTR